MQMTKTGGRHGHEVEQDKRTIVIKIPMKFTRRGGRKKIVAPDGADGWGVPRLGPDDALLKALARAHRWKNLLEGGDVASVKELAKVEEIDDSYMSRILRLTLLAPDIVDAILAGQQPETMTLANLTKPFPMEWERQR